MAETAAAADARFELVTSASSQQFDFAAALTAVLSFSNLPPPTPLLHTVLEGAALDEYSSSLRTGPFIPCLFDNFDQVEVSQPTAILKYAARLGALEGDSPSAKLRADLSAEAVLRFLKTAAMTSHTVHRQQVHALKGILTQTSGADEGGGAGGITYGDVLAALYLERVAAIDTTLLGELQPLYSAWSKNERMTRALADARAIRSASNATSTPASSGNAPAAPATTAAAATAARVLVTGASGFIASWLVKALLARGYLVHATVRNAADTARVSHLRSLPGAADRLRLFSADLLGAPGSFDAAMAGCECVFHCASPFFFTPKVDPEEELLRPAVEGTRTVMRSALACATVRRVVLTSSAAAVYVNPKNPVDYYYTEDDWSDEGYLLESKQWYALSKTQAEREAWRILREEAPASRLSSHPLRLSTICPTQTLGPLLQPAMNTSCSAILDLLNGSKRSILNKGKCFVDVRDVALAHVYAWEQGVEAGASGGDSGRFLLMAQSIPWATVASVLRRTLPGARVPPADAVDPGPHTVPQAIWSMKRTHDLGVVYTPIEDSIRDCALSIYAKGFLDGVIAPVKGAASSDGSSSGNELETGAAAAPGSLASSHPPGHITATTHAR